MNENSLIRDLDTLGVQDEVELIIEHASGKYKMSSTIFDNEYAACLAYNDTHKHKIVLAYCNHTRNADITNNYPVCLAINILITFSNGSRITFSYNPMTDITNLYIKEEDKETINHSLKEASIRFHIKSSVITSLFTLLSNHYPKHSIVVR